MLLTVDVGNTNTVFGLYDFATEKPATAARMSTRRDRMPDEWYAILAPVLTSAGIEADAVSDMIISSVVPNVTRWLTEMGQTRLGVDAIVVNAALDLGIGIDYANPSEIGPDRLVNSVAALTKYGAPAIVIDFGTAINFDVIDHRGMYVGGALAPGLLVSLEAMTSRAARLFSVELTLPQTAIAQSTSEAIQSGMMFGYLSLIEGMVDRISAELRSSPSVVITGGYSEIFAAASDRIDAHEPDLTSDGLRMIYERLSGKPAIAKK